MCTLGGDANPADRTFLRPAGDVVGFAVELDQLDVEFRADGVHGVFAVGEHRVGVDRTRVFGHEHRMPRAAATRWGWLRRVSSDARFDAVAINHQHIHTVRATPDNPTLSPPPTHRVAPARGIRGSWPNNRV